MPIYAYKCDSCGLAKDVLQKISDPLLTLCPACGSETFTKQLTAAGFQLKGSGWYATDFKGGSSSVPPAESTSVKEGNASDTKSVEASVKTDASSSASPAPSVMTTPAS
jgi:putative FmdB family regulatory protein